MFVCVAVIGLREKRSMRREHIEDENELDEEDLLFAIDEIEEEEEQEDIFEDEEEEKPTEDLTSRDIQDDDDDDDDENEEIIDNLVTISK